jgi:hypothetical protein
MPLNVMIAELDVSGLAAPPHAVGDSKSPLACKANSLSRGQRCLSGRDPVLDRAARIPSTLLGER